MEELTLHPVRGFDPLMYVYPLRDGQNMPLVNANTGKPQMRLATNALKTWFRMSFPNGKISVEPLPSSSTKIRVRARVYSDFNLPEASFLGEGVAETVITPGPSTDLMQLTANSAISAALFNAGFGCQVALYLKTEENEPYTATVNEDDVPFAGPSAASDPSGFAGAPRADNSLERFLSDVSPTSVTVGPDQVSEPPRKAERKARSGKTVSAAQTPPAVDEVPALTVVTEPQAPPAAAESQASITPEEPDSAAVPELQASITSEHHAAAADPVAEVNPNAIFSVTDTASAGLRLYGGTPLSDVPSTLIKTIARSEMLQSMVSSDTLAAIKAAAANIA